MEDYVKRLSNQPLRTAFLAYAEEKHLNTQADGPYQSWANGKTILHFSAFAHAWERGVEVPDPVEFASLQAARRWYEEEVAYFAEIKGQTLPAWEMLTIAQQRKVSSDHKIMQQNFDKLGAEFSRSVCIQLQ